MKYLSRLVRASKKTKIGVAIATALVVMATSAAVYAGYGPERQVFDWNNNPGGCDLQANRGDRCGAIQPTFNSFINTPSYGDERNFTRIAPVTAGESPVNADFSETQAATPGKEYWVRTLVHNDANQNLNCTPEHRDAATNDCTQVDAGSPGIATGTTVSLEIPSGVANGIDVMTKVKATNATPSTVWDTATLTSAGQAFSVEYENGSAVLYNGVHQTGTPLSDSIMTAAGAPVGYNQMDGVVPGCFDFSAYVYVKVKVSAPAIKFEKLVRMKGEASDKWRSELTAKKGDHVQYLLDYLNNGSGVDNNVVIRDQLPSNIELVPGSVKWIDINHPAPGQAVPDDLLFSPGGVILGNYGVNGGGYIMFEATVKSDLTECVAKNVAFVRGDNVPEVSSNATVTVSDCKPVQPVVSCDLLSPPTKLGDRKYSYAVKYSPMTNTNEVKFKNVTYDFGDGTTPLTTDKNPAEYTYQKDGTYSTKVTVNFMVNGQDKSVTGGTCVQPLTVNTVTPPAKPTVLPNTGAGSMIGIFSTVTVAGALIHRFVLSRRFNA